jgi:hypothetical protein
MLKYAPFLHSYRIITRKYSNKVTQITIVNLFKLFKFTSKRNNRLPRQIPLRLRVDDALMTFHRRVDFPAFYRNCCIELFVDDFRTVIRKKSRYVVVQHYPNIVRDIKCVRLLRSQYIILNCKRLIINSIAIAV